MEVPVPRRSIEVDTFRHQNPIPCASRVGPLVMSSIIPPFDPGTRDVPDTAEQQIENLFTHVGAMLKEAGADWKDVAKMTFYAGDGSARELLNSPWSARFPDLSALPARHTQITPGTKQISCDFVAYVEG